MQIKLTKYEVEKIRKEYFEGKKQTELAKEYGITQGHISSVISGRKRSKNES